MTSLETRKHLLITESELNRIQLVEDWAGVKAEVQQWVDQFRPVVSIIASVATITAAFTRLYHRLPRSLSGANGKRSWVFRTLHGVQTGAALWQAVRIHRASRY